MCRVQPAAAAAVDARAPAMPGSARAEGVSALVYERNLAAQVRPSSDARSRLMAGSETHRKPNGKPCVA